MKHETNKENELIVKESSDSFQNWIAKDYISRELKNELKQADVLIVPIENFRGIDNPVFPEGTEQLYTYLMKQFSSNDEYNIDICIDDEDYMELALHDDLINLGYFVLTIGVAPIFVNLISDYISNKFLSYSQDRKIKTSISIVEDDGSSKEIKYEGDIEHFSSVIDEIEDLWERRNSWI